MLCDNCKEQPATVHLTQVFNDERREVHLCEACAGKAAEDIGLSWSGFSFNKLLGGLLEPESSFAGLSQPPTTPAAECPQCGLTFADFRRRGHLGCGRCYETFAPQLESVLRRIQGSTTHEGKIPKRVAGPIRVRRELAQMRQELQEAVAKEAYEKAAELRDRIRAMEQRDDRRVGGEA